MNSFEERILLGYYELYNRMLLITSWIRLCLFWKLYLTRIVNLFYYYRSIISKLLKFISPSEINNISSKKFLLWVKLFSRSFEVDYQLRVYGSCIVHVENLFLVTTIYERIVMKSIFIFTDRIFQIMIFLIIYLVLMTSPYLLETLSLVCHLSKCFPNSYVKTQKYTCIFL